MNKKISFVGVGAVKSGSSWMASLLKQHPEVCMSSRKEIAYFNAYNFNGTKNTSSLYSREYYFKFWPQTNLVKGEVSPQYLFDSYAPQNIKDAFPNTQIIVILRNPKHVVYSLFLYEQLFNRSINTSLSFSDALSKYPYLLESARFYKQLKRYYSIFKKEQIHVYILEDALTFKEGFSKKLYADIGLSNIDFIPDYSSVNESKQMDSSFFNSLIQVPSFLKSKVESSRLNPYFEKCKGSSLYINLVGMRNKFLDLNVKSLQKPIISKEDSLMLDVFYKSEIEKLEVLIDKDLSMWKTIDFVSLARNK